MSFSIRVMTRDDLDRALGWAQEEGWNPGLEDATAFHAADPTGFLMGYLDDEPVSSISVVKYGESFAFLGLYIVRPAFRGRGFGKAIWDAGIASAGRRTIGLDGVVAQQDNYKQSGFVLAHRSARWGGTLDGEVARSSFVRPIEESDFAAVLAYDAAIFPARRDAFLRAWLSSSARRTEGFFEDGVLRGYGTVRRCVDGAKLGPLFADSPAVAEALIAKLGAAAPGNVFIDIPEPNAAAIAMAKRLALTPAFETARMYRGKALDLPLDRIFGVTTLELG
jgi:GNAT superfamily N-acetyltransferase